MTLPWSDMGMRLLPTATFFKYKQRMTELEQEFERLVNNFFDIYDDAVINAQTLLGDLYNPDNYPPLDVLRHKFKFAIELYTHFLQVATSVWRWSRSKPRHWQRSMTSTIVPCSARLLIADGKTGFIPCTAVRAS